MTVQRGSIELAASVHGPSAGPAVLLISPADAPAFRWTAAYVDALTGLGARVVRFDHRDVGASTAVPDTDPYTLADLAADAVAVLESAAVDRAHIVGRSMGGMVGQLLALDHPDLVASLTMVGTTPAMGDDSLSGPSDDLVDKIAWRLFDGPPASRAERVAWLVDGYRNFAGPRFPFETRLQRALALREVDECWRPETGHGVAVGASPGRLDRLDQIEVPTTIVHGTADPVFGVDHAVALADGIAGAELRLIEGLGHELPDAFAPTLVAEVRRLLAGYS